jgi:hypothetical protein
MYRKERQDKKCETAMIDNTAAHSSSPRPDERPEVDVGCPICENLKRAYEAGLSEYIEARSSACYGISKKIAAQKNVEMERAKYELEEHQFACLLAVRAPKRDLSANSRHLVA